MENMILEALMVFLPISVVSLILGIIMQNKVFIRTNATALCAMLIFILTILAQFAFFMMGLLEVYGIFYAYIPVIYSILIFALVFLNIWQLFKKKARTAVSISLAGVIMLFSIGVVGYGIYQYSLPIYTTEGEMPLYSYEPFAENTRAADLEGESTLELTGNLPVLDGATALYPLYSAFARATYPAGDYGVYDYDYIRDTDRYIAISPVICLSTDTAFTALINGDTDIAFLMGISKEQQERADALGVELTLTPIGREAFVFFVNNRNKINNVSSENIRRIYTGEVKNWNEIGGENAEIIAYQRPEGSGSQTRLIEIMGGYVMTPPKSKVYGSMMGMYEVVADYKNYKNSLGYSFLYYIRDMADKGKVRFLSIDGIAPTPETIASGEYPFINNFYAVTVSNRTDSDPEKAENIEKLLLWIQSEQGQSLVEKTGYVPLDG
jgi:phosphate transport system substrate-binding protein